MKPDNTNKRLPRSAPEAQGIPSSAISAFLDDAEANVNDLHSLMLLRHGHVVAEGWWSPYAPDIPHMLYSLSKSFTSTAVGMAVEEGLLSIEDPVLSFFADDAPAHVSDNLAAMRVLHLLSMNTGHADDLLEHLRDSEDPNWTRTFLAIPVTYEPGTHFLYNSGASYLLSAIVQQLTGQTLVEYLGPRLFEPLGIRNPSWQTCPRGINTGGWGLSITTEDIACFGQMYLQNGLWNGRRLLPASWIAQATSYHSDNSINQDEIDWQQGYGFQFWLCRHNAYRGDGAFGQFCVVMPDQDAVFAATAGVENMQAVLDLVWKHLLPAMQPEALSDNAHDAERLRARMSSLALPHPTDKAPSPIEHNLSGQRFAFAKNEQGIESITVQFRDDTCVLGLCDARGDHEIMCGRSDWHMQSTDLLFADENLVTSQQVAASSAWIATDTLEVTLCFYETPHCLTLTCQFDQNKVYFKRHINVSFDDTEIPQLEGHSV